MDWNVAEGGDHEPMPLEGGLVEIRGMGSRQARVWQQEQGADGEPEMMGVDGQQGRCIGSLMDTKEYLVATFDGLLVAVPPEFAAECALSPPEDGGFDLAWPASAEYEEEFAVQLAEILRTKGYGVVQMSVSSGTREDAAYLMKALEDHGGIREETVVDYLGRANRSKVKSLEDDDPSVDPATPLDGCDRLLTNAGYMLAPMALEAFNFELIGRTGAFARLPCPPEEIHTVAPALTDDDIRDGKVEGFLKFVQARKMCMILTLKGEGGEVVLLPKPGEGDEVHIPIAENRLLIFRHDLMSYSYKPEGDSAALQAWMVTGIPDVEMRSLEGNQEQYAELMDITGPWQPEGDQAFVKSLMVRMPGRSWGYWMYWNMYVAGTDCVIEWSGSRWEIEPYYEVDRDRAMMTGKSYMHHGGFLDETEFSQFDNGFFDLSEEEAMCMYPGQRIVMETGYEALYRAGYTKSSAAGELVGVHLGDVGPDWHSIDASWPYMVQGDFTLRRLGVDASVTCTRLSHHLNLVGPTNSVATACSSSLVALNIAHHAMANVRDDKSRQATGAELYERSLVIGINTLMGPVSFCGQCTTGGTSYKGRSFTFDSGADGYQRGEGCSATFIQMKGDAVVNENRLACVIGSAVNQDGRSASLTAPNGPSQAALCRDAMKMARLTPPEVTAAECHGTGTALGDPIEVGALQNVLSKRDRAILKTSAKSNMAHLEASAGMAGFAKCIMMINTSATPPNQHLKLLNPHLTVEGYPVYFTSELTPWSQNSGYCGVSSFGIGGTNARGEILGRCQKGPESTAKLLADYNSFDRKIDFVTVSCPRCLGPMCWLDGAAIPKPQVTGKYQPGLLRDEWADYTYCSSCYAEEGREFRFGNEIKAISNPNLRVLIRGTWDAFSGAEEMEEASSGTYVFHVALGDTRCERFQLCVEGTSRLLLYPARDQGDQSARIQGPDENGRDKYWLLDGRDEEVAAGTIYEITFQWKGDKKSITWKPAEEVPDKIAGKDFQHKYSVCGSWNSWKHKDLRKSRKDEHLYEATFKFGAYGKEEFYFTRDHDEEQVIYPAVPVNRASQQMTPHTMPVRGPDDRGAGKCWLIHGEENETVTVQLHVKDARIMVTVRSRSLGGAQWVSLEGWARKKYFLTGSFNDWSMMPMAAKKETPGAFTAAVVLPRFLATPDDEHFGAEFQVVVDADPTQRMYPMLNGSGSGEGFLEGPAKGAEKLRWLIQGQPGDEFIVTLDMKAPDRRRMVTWRPSWMEEEVQAALEG